MTDPIPTSTEHPIDVVAATVVDHWTEIRVDSDGHYYGRRGDMEQERPVVRYSRDASRALHLIRKAIRDARTQYQEFNVYIAIDHEEVSVEASRTKIHRGSLPDREDEVFFEVADRTDLLPLLLTKCAVAIASLK